MKLPVCFFLFLYGFLNLLEAPLLAQSTKMERLWEDFMSDESLKSASLGFALTNLNNGETVFSWQSDKVLVPASVLKLYTTAAALHHLGPDYRFRTILLLDGSVENGVLHGNLILKGYGDPSLASAIANTGDLNALKTEWIKAVKKSGIQKISGDIVADDSFFDRPEVPDNWQWADIGNHYGAGARAINVADNMYTLTFKQQPDLMARPEIVNIDPPIKGLVLKNELTSAGAKSGDNAYIFGAPNQMERIIRGTIPIGRDLFTIKGSIPDPPQFAAQLLADALREENIDFDGSIRVIRSAQDAIEPTNAGIIWERRSPSLSTLIQVVNKKSNNTFAEAIFMQLSKLQDETVTEDAISSFLKEIQCNDMPLYMTDGSGLSRQNGLTAAQMNCLLQHMAQNNAFRQSLAVPGADGTLRNSFKQLPRGVTLSAKSGSMTRVRAYAGYFKKTDGSEFAFTLLCNQFSGSNTALIRKIEQLLYQLSRS